MSEHCVKKIRKDTGIVIDMIAIIAFFFSILSAKTDALSCAPDMERAVSNTQIPAIYLQLVSKKTKRSTESSQGKITGVTSSFLSEGWTILWS